MDGLGLTIIGIILGLLGFLATMYFGVIGLKKKIAEERVFDDGLYFDISDVMRFSEYDFWFKITYKSKFKATNVVISTTQPYRYQKNKDYCILPNELPQESNCIGELENGDYIEFFIDKYISTSRFHVFFLVLRIEWDDKRGHHKIIKEVKKE